MSGISFLVYMYLSYISGLVCGGYLYRDGKWKAIAISVVINIVVAGMIATSYLLGILSSEAAK